MYIAVKTWCKDDLKEKAGIERITADGDLVYLPVRNNIGNKTIAVVDIFRIENGRIEEH